VQHEGYECVNSKNKCEAMKDVGRVFARVVNDACVSAKNKGKVLMISIFFSCETPKATISLINVVSISSLFFGVSISPFGVSGGEGEEVRGVVKVEEGEVARVEGEAARKEEGDVAKGVEEDIEDEEDVARAVGGCISIEGGNPRIEGGVEEVP
jgi:hypothetical protein